MKKLYTLLIGLMFVFSLYSQDVTHSKILKATQTKFGITETQSDIAENDTMGSQYDVIDYVLTLNKEYPVEYYIYTNLDSTAGTPVVAVNLSGRVWTDESWTSITTYTWNGTSTDTSIVFQTTTGNSYTIAMTGTDTAALALTGTDTLSYAFTGVDTFAIALSGVDTMAISLSTLDTFAISLTGTDTAAFIPMAGDTVIYGATTSDGTAYGYSAVTGTNYGALTLTGTAYGASAVTGTSYGASTNTGTSYGALTFSGTMTITPGTVKYRQLRIRYTRSAGNCTIDVLKPKIWEIQK